MKDIETLKNQLEKLKPLKTEDEQRLWKKFRLEWNYNSNHIEGNTLTFSATELLLFFDKVSGDYTGREIEEMKAHDVAIKMVIELTKENERDLNESFIRDLNKIILVRPFWKEAIDFEGKKTKREITPGEYKKFPNSVMLPNGSLFNYASPEETAAKMEELLNFYTTNSKSSDVDPIWLAAMLHYKFVLIHPFDDGNGRIARLLMNFVLIKNGYPPVIIKDAEKNKYLLALNKADTGDLASFFEYIKEQVKWSLNKSILAAEGKSIEDEDDLDKELSLLKKNALSSTKVQIKKSQKVLQNTYNDSIKSFLSEIESQLSKFDSLFVEKECVYTVENAIETNKIKSPGQSLKYIEDQIFFDHLNPIKYGHIPGITYTSGIPNTPISPKEIHKINLTTIWKAYKNAGTKLFNIHSNIELIFEEFKYKILNNHKQDILIEKLYSQNITESECKEIAKDVARKILDNIYNSIEASKHF